MALITVSAGFMREMLQLPDECEIVRIECAPGYHGRFNLVVEGAGWPVSDGMPIGIPVAATVDIPENDEVAKYQRVIDWHLPA